MESFCKKNIYVTTSYHTSYSSRKFRKYKSATVHFSRPYSEKYREEFKKEIGDNIYVKLILHLAEVKCSIIPFQSAAFTLGCDEALVRLKTGNKKEKEGIYNGLSKFLVFFRYFL